MSHTEIKNHYNEKLTKNSDYEKERWDIDDVQKANFEMTKESVVKGVGNIDFEICLELGPGHGTWTKELFEKNPDARFDLVDISSGMLASSKERFRERKNIEYFESDFLKFEPGRKYDFFFSSRAIEYIEPKLSVVEKIAALLKKDGQGFVITKTPHYARMKVLGRKPAKMHSNQIVPRRLKRLMQENGLEVESVRPVTFSWPFWKSVAMNKRLFAFFSKKEICPISQFFSESYSIKFRKK